MVPVNLIVAPRLAELPATNVPAPPIDPDKVKIPEFEAVKVPVLAAVKATGFAILIEAVAMSVPPVMVKVPTGLLILLAFPIDKVPELTVVPPV